MNLIPKKFYLDDVFDNFLTSDNSNMKCDIYLKDNNYHIDMDIPGFNKKDIKIDLDNGYLTISAKKEDVENNDDKNYIRHERIYSSYSRQFYLGEVSEENIKATFNDGMLHLTIPKEIENKNKKMIEIE